MLGLNLGNNQTLAAVHKYWNTRPCNLRHSPQPVGTKEYFDEVEARKYLVEPHIPKFADFPSWKGKRVLEIGCGLGTDTMNFARAGARVTAVDLTERSLELARRRAEVYGLQDRVRFYQANAEELSAVVPVEPYDLVYSFGVIHHTPHPENVLRQARKYMHPGSVLKVMVYHTWSTKVFGIMARSSYGRFWKMTELVARQSEAQTGCPVTFTYSRRGGRRLLENEGFTVADSWVDHVFPYVVSEYKEYRYRKAWYYRWMPRPLFRGLERAFGWHLCLTARLS